jgi:5-methylcytosine-specific restriction protein B
VVGDRPHPRRPKDIEVTRRSSTPNGDYVHQQRHEGAFAAAASIVR